MGAIATETLSLKRPRVAVLVPALNEERDIARVVLSAQKQSDLVIVCDDGSRDLTSDIAEALGADVVRHEHNLGYGAALLSLFKRAREVGADVVVTFDGDGQHEAAFISQLVEPIFSNDADVVVGSRFEKDSHTETSRFRRFGIGTINYVTEKVARKKFSDTQCGMRAYRTKVLPAIFPSETGMGASTEILVRASQAGLRVMEMGVHVSQRNSSTQNPFFQWLDVVGSTIKRLSIGSPLRFYGVPAALFLIMGIVFGVWAIDGYIATRRLVVNLTVLSLASAIIGLILGTTAVILYSVRSIVREQVQQLKDS
jgi:hypothetical protein